VTLGKGVTFSTVRAVSGKATVPQVFVGGKLIGGADEVEAYFGAGSRKAA
jgi:glutaredoxin